MSMTEHEQEIALIEQQRIDERQDNQKRMAWVAMASMIGYTVAMLLPFISESRLATLTEIASLFYIAQAGVVGAYMGSEAIVNRSRNNKVNSSQQSPRVGR